MSRAEELRLLDILEAIATVHGYVPEPGEPLVGGTRDAILYNLVVLGEAAAHISSATRARAPEVAWQQVVGLRNLLAHEYFRIDAEIVTSIVREQLAPLEQSIRRLLEGA